MLKHPERPTASPGRRRRSGEWLAYLVIALAAGVVSAFGVPWWLAVPVALVLELVCGLVLHAGRRRR